MTRVQCWALAVAGLALAPLGTRAQSAAESAPLSLGDFSVSGTATGGYRFER